MRLHSIKQYQIHPYKNRDNFNFQVKHLPYSADEMDVKEHVPTIVEHKLVAYMQLCDESKNKLAQQMWD